MRCGLSEFVAVATDRLRGLSTRRLNGSGAIGEPSKEPKVKKVGNLGVVLSLAIGLLSGYAAAMLPGDGAAFRQCVGLTLYAVYDEGWGYKYVSLTASC